MGLTKVTKKVLKVSAEDIGALPVAGKAADTFKLEGKTKSQVVAEAKAGTVPSTTTVNGKPLTSNVTISASDVGALPNAGKAADTFKLEGKTKAQVLAEAKAGTVASTTTVNGHALTKNINLNAGDVGALPTGGTATNSSGLEGASKAEVIAEAKAGTVPSTTTVNGKPLTSNITLTPADVDALPAGGKATNSSALEGKTKAQVVAEAKAGTVASTTTVNGHALTDNIALTPDDVGALPVAATARDSVRVGGKTKGEVVTEAKTGMVPDTRTVNGHRLNANLALTAADVGASPSNHQHDAYVAKTAIGANNGVASLDATGKVPQSQLPAIAISDTFPCASQAEMLALKAERGDIAIRNDVNQSFILRAEPASNAANWLALLTPTSKVQSVNNQIGVVVLTAADVGALAAGGTAVNALKIEGKSKAQVIAEARAGLSPTNHTHSQYVTKDDVNSLLKKDEYILTESVNTLTLKTVKSIIMVAINGVVQSSGAYSLSGTELTIAEFLDPKDEVVIVGI